MSETPKIFDELNRIAPLIPTPIYWLDTNCIIRGGNDHCLNAIGSFTANISEVLIGKTYYDYYPKEIADELTKMTQIVLETQQATKTEEKIIDITTGKFRYYETGRAPLFNNGELVGTICSAIEITDRKEAELLKLENEKQKLENTSQKIQIEEQQKFSQIANQLSHDIRSPLAANQIWFRSIQYKLNEEERIMGRRSLERAMDILNSGFVRYKPNSNNSERAEEAKQPLMIYSALEDILAEKRLEHQQHPIIIKASIIDEAFFAFVAIKPSALKRMVSNLINNAVDALENKSNGEITLHLHADQKTVTLVIEDNGKGMPDGVKEKILCNTSVTVGKAHGNGIGLVQVCNTLKESDGTLSIISYLGQGTQMKITFPRIPAPNWIAERIQLTPDTQVVILDDDPSIYDAWRSRFNTVSLSKPLEYFEQGEKALHFLENLPNKDNVFLLADFELLNQPINGLDVIEKVQLPHAFLVTSHVEDEAIRKRASYLNVRLLPKQLAANIPIELEAIKTDNTIQSCLSAEAVLIDDDRLILDSLVSFVFAQRRVDTYTRPQECLAQLNRYKKSTLFFIDLNYSNNAINGLDVAEQLHQQGFYQLCLLTGDASCGEAKVPNYLTVILKTDTTRLKAIAESYLKSAQDLDSISHLPAPSPSLKNKPLPIVSQSTTLDILLQHLSHEILNSLSITQINVDLITMLTQSNTPSFEEFKRAILERTANIKQSRQECAQALSMEIAKLRAILSIQDDTLLKPISIKNTLQLALSQYAFRAGEKSRIDCSLEASFYYKGNEGLLKQLLFHVLKEGITLLREEFDGKIIFRCLSDQKNVLTVQYPGGYLVPLPESEDDNFLENDNFPLNAKLSRLFYRSVMLSFGGTFEEILIDNLYQLSFYFPPVSS